MNVSLETLTQIIHSFSVSTGIPSFLIDDAGTIHRASPGFSPQDYEFADTGQLRDTVLEGLQRGTFASGQHQTLYTDHQFIYNLVCVKWAEETDSETEVPQRQVLVAGPMRLKPATIHELRTITPRDGQNPPSMKLIAHRVSMLPHVPMSRVYHLGRAQAALYQSYRQEPEPLADPTAEIGPAADHVQVLPVSFTLVDESSHAPQELLIRVKEMVLSGNVEGSQDIWKQMAAAPIDRLIQTDPVKSARYNLIATCGTIVGMMFDEGVPYEQLMMTADRHIQDADRVVDLSEMARLMRRSVEDFAHLAKQYCVRNYSRPVRRVLQFAQSNMLDKIRLQDLAERVGLSPSYLSRLIKRETGRSLSELVTSYRITESKFLLLHTDRTILEIAQMVGYTYQNHFTERFKVHTGTTPSQYRLSGRQEG